MKIKIYTISLLLSAVLGSCSSSFLDEKPLDFMSATNSFLTQENFIAGMKIVRWITSTARILSMMVNRMVRSDIPI